MTGPEHYTEAQRIESCILSGDRDLAGFTGWSRAELIALAQVHATLAVAAATARPAIVAHLGIAADQDDREWTQVTAS